MKKIMTGLVGIVLLISIIVIAVMAEGDKRIENGGSESQEKLVTIGFSQVGAESDWRTANSISIKQTFTPERGYDLLFEDAKQKQSNQIMAIRRFIQQEVDYIVFSPVVESGWDTVLEEAKRAGIPVIVIDRKVSVRDTVSTLRGSVRISIWKDRRHARCSITMWSRTRYRKLIL